MTAQTAQRWKRTRRCNCCKWRCSATTSSTSPATRILPRTWLVGKNSGSASGFEITVRQPSALHQRHDQTSQHETEHGVIDEVDWQKEPQNTENRKQDHPIRFAHWASVLASSASRFGEDREIAGEQHDHHDACSQQVSRWGG